LSAAVSSTCTESCTTKVGLEAFAMSLARLLAATANNFLTYNTCFRQICPIIGTKPFTDSFHPYSGTVEFPVAHVMLVCIICPSGKTALWM